MVFFLGILFLFKSTCRVIVFRSGYAHTNFLDVSSELIFTFQNFHLTNIIAGEKNIRRIFINLFVSHP